MSLDKKQNDSLEEVLTTDYKEIDLNIKIPPFSYYLRDIRLVLGKYINPEEFKVMRKKAAAISFP